MGGCASKPKEESDILNVSLPTDDVVAPEKAEGETVADQGTINNVDEIQNEAPLIDLSKEEDENSSSEQKTSTVEAAPVSVEAAPVSVEAHEQTAKIAEDKVEDPTNELKDVKVEANNETKEPAKEAQVEAQVGAKIDKSDVAPLSGDKSDAPLSTTA